MTPIYVDVHVLQSVPPSNLNRDDAGSPKQAVYGGVRRARVSSQAWKRATRTAFAGELPTEQLSTRTRRIGALLTGELETRSGGDRETCGRVTAAVLAGLDIKTNKKRESETAYLLFVGRRQLRELADLVAPLVDELAGVDGKELEKAVQPHIGAVRGVLSGAQPLDVALFGRMVADVTDLNVDAAAQVAHALSTHAVEAEFDYYTAVDDENADDEAGAGMIGTVEFTSATLYRFASVAVHQLLDNVGGDVDACEHALRLFLTCFVTAMPSGHINSFGNRTLPSLVAYAVRDNQPVNLVSAFEAPVASGSSGGTLAASARALAAEWREVTNVWGMTARRTAACYLPTVGTAEVESILGPSQPLDAAVGGVVAEALSSLRP